MSIEQRKFELGDKVLLNTPSVPELYGRQGIIEKREKVFGKPILYTVRSDSTPHKLCVGCDCLLLVEPITPPLPNAPQKPKDGDRISLHRDHKIVDAEAGGKTYKYCRTCKVEVSEDERWKTRHLNTLTGNSDFVQLKDIWK